MGKCLVRTVHAVSFKTSCCLRSASRVLIAQDRFFLLFCQQSKKDTTSNAAPKDKETRTATTNTPAGETVTAEQPKPQEGKGIISLLSMIGADLYPYRFWLNHT
jgi:hypothetical protein